MANRLRLDPSRTRAGAKAIKEADKPKSKSPEKAKPPEPLKSPASKPKPLDAKSPKEKEDNRDALGREKPLPALPVE